MQHDMDIANQGFGAFRADLNNALKSLAGNNSGATEPATTFAYQLWADTTSGILKQRNAANSAWINVLNMATGVPFGAAAPGANADITSMSGLVGPGLFPVGGLFVHTGNAAPAGYIKANGALLSRTAYANLWAFAQSSGAMAASDGAWTNGQYSPGDGSTTFRIPDLRAEFIRMWDDGRGVDSGRGFGSAQLDALQGHKHLSSADSGSTGSAAAGGGNPVATQGSATGLPISDGTNGTPRTASETRPRSVAYLPCIKY